MYEILVTNARTHAASFLPPLHVAVSRREDLHLEEGRPRSLGSTQVANLFEFLRGRWRTMDYWDQEF